MNELEDELQKTKTYYHKRIRELEDKYKFNAGPDKKNGTKATGGEATRKTSQAGSNIIDIAAEEDGVRVKEQLVKLAQLRD